MKKTKDPFLTTSGAQSLLKCGWCCSFFSVFAVICLFALSKLISSGYDSIEIEDDERNDASTACLSAAIVYCVFLILSLSCCYFAKRTLGVSNTRGSRVRYHQLPELHQQWASIPESTTHLSSVQIKEFSSKIRSESQPFTAHKGQLSETLPPDVEINSQRSLSVPVTSSSTVDNKKQFF